ncbi:MAG: hypothetical protein JW808_12030 [Victivallales bacterium]|nr:hypothetical protein [Victivallales bacterium]
MNYIDKTQRRAAQGRDALATANGRNDRISRLARWAFLLLPVLSLLLLSGCRLFTVGG